MARRDGTTSDTVAQQHALRSRLRHPSGDLAAFTPDEVQGTVAARLASMTAAHANRVAVSTGKRTLTYAELDQAANRVARALERRRSSRENPIAIVMAPCAELLVAICAATKAGQVHAVLRPDAPVDHMAYLLQDLGDPLILTTPDMVPFLQGVATYAAGIVDVADALARESDDPVQAPVTPDAPYLIRYTSGSTGRPKGVVSAHTDFLEYMRVQAGLGQFCAQDRFATSSDTYFAAITAVLLGASFFDLHLSHTGMPAFARGLAQHGITYLMASTTAYRQLLRSTERLRYPDLRYIHLYGEPPTPGDIAAADGVFATNAVFCNQYGTTESYILAAFYTTPDRARHLDALPAGYVVENMDITLLDAAGAPVAAGEIGEIVARSRYLTRGYWRQPELTGLRFFPEPETSRGHAGRHAYFTGDLGRMDPDGCLHYMGRKDFQVKIRAQRVEITAVEAALRAIPGVKDAAVVARSGPGGDLRLVAYLAAAEGELTASFVRRWLSERLPAAMVPAAYVFLAALPLTASQKVDRLSLPEPGSERPQLDVQYAAPRTPVEKRLAGIWAEVLGLEQVGIHDNFLDLGGDSLLASQIVTRVVERQQTDLPLTALYGAPTVNEMALAITQAAAATVSPSEIEELLAKVEDGE